MLAQQVLDAFGLDRGLVVHPTGAHRPGPQRPTLPVGDGGGLEVFCLCLPDTNARRPARLARGF
jgi:hypothetical protein